MARKQLTTIRETTATPHQINSEHELDILGQKILQSYVEILKQDGVTGSLLGTRSVWEKEGETWYLYFYLPEYWIWEEWGRGPGKMPPGDVIEQWVASKGRYLLPPFEDKDIPSISWAIRVNIGRNGTKGKHSLVRVFEEHPEYLDQVAACIAEIEIDQSLVDELNEDWFDV